MTVKAEKRRDGASLWFWGTVDSSGWPKDFWEQSDKADEEMERKRKERMKISGYEKQKQSVWMAEATSRHKTTEKVRTFKVGDRNLTAVELWEARLPYVDSVEIKFFDFQNAQPSWLEARARELESWEKAVTDAYKTPEMQLVLNQKTNGKKIRKAQQRNEFMNAVLRVGLLFQKFSPAERQELRGVLESNGAVDWYTKGAALDAAVLEAHPDPIERDDALAGAEVIYRRLDSGLDIDGAFRAKNLYLDNRARSRENMGAVRISVETVQKALAASGGSKSGAARTLGISRAKVRRLTGERM
jgi:hypothetical protein